MSDQTDKIRFVDYHRPDLSDGDYTITVTQTIKGTETIKAKKQNFSDSSANATLQFSVLGPRFTLDPQLIEGVFPPPGSLGDHANVLPHILLNRSTLPWERMAVNDAKTIAGQTHDTKELPWLALLLFDEGELPPIEYDLRLISVPTTDVLGKARKLFIVEFVNNLLHIRIFNIFGKKVVDKKEKEKDLEVNEKYLEGGEMLEAFKARLKLIPNESNLSKKDKQKIIEDAALIANFNLNNNVFFISDLKTLATGEINWPGITSEKGQHDDDPRNGA